MNVKFTKIIKQIEEELTETAVFSTNMRTAFRLEVFLPQDITL